MQIDRWVLPPAAAAALFTMMAIAPPGGPVARGLRIEVAGAPSASPAHPLLVRLVMDDAGTARWRVPREATLRLWSHGAPGTAFAARAVPGAPYLFGQVFPAGEGPYQLEVIAEGSSVRVPVASRAVAVPRPEAPAPGASGIDSVIEGGVLVPDVPGTLLLRVAEGSARGLRARPTDPSVQVRPERQGVDACGVAAFGVDVHGLDAHVELSRDEPGAPAVHRRLAVAPGALSVVAAGDGVDVSTAVGGRAVYVLAGDAGGPTYWTAQWLDDPSDRAPRAHAAVPAGSAWALASLSPAFDVTSGAWLEGTSVAGACASTPWGARFARASAPTPEPVQPTLAHDGAAVALRAREARKDRARRVSLALAGLSVLVLAALVLGAGLSRERAELRAVAHPPRSRALVALGGVGALLLGGLALYALYALRL